jgi:endonuclease/exonuclease/phosphatase family metal-dependent hydrolase
MARKPRLTPEQRLAADALQQIASTPGGLRAILILAVIGLIAWGGWTFWQHHHAPGQTASNVENPGTIRIATWNLRKFGERDKANQHPPDLVAIADIIKSSGFDLIAIQEVQQEGQEIQKLRRQLNEPWRHVISERTGNNERFAFLYRGDRVELIDTPHLMSKPTAQVFDRAPFMATFRAGQFDFTLVTVHLSYTDTARRRREAEALARFAKDLAAHAAEKDVIVLGDFNEQHQHGNLPFFDEQGWTRLNTEATNLGSTEIYDNFLIDRNFTREWTGRTGVIRFDETRFANNDHRALEDVSDHRPAWADFATVGPDDD